jgi:hypothetical protein
MVIEENLQLPRLTGTLRAFSKVSRKFTDPDASQDKRAIQKRKDLMAKQKELGCCSSDETTTTTTASFLDWPTLLIQLVPPPSRNDSKYAKLNESLHKLRQQMAKQFLNEDLNDANLLDEAALFIFEVFYDHRNCDQAMLNSNFEASDKLMKKLREKFGQFARNLFDSCKELMEVIYNDLKNSNRIYLLDECLGSRHIQVLTTEQDHVISENYFGENIKFTSFYDKLATTSQEPSWSSSSDEDDESSFTSSCSSSDEESESEIDFQFKFPIDSQPKTSDDQRDDQLKYLAWTQDLSREMCSLVFESLSKRPNSNQAQNELLELLGFERIELCEFLFSNSDNDDKAYTI